MKDTTQISKQEQERVQLVCCPKKPRLEELAAFGKHRSCRCHRSPSRKLSGSRSCAYALNALKGRVNERRALVAMAPSSSEAQEGPQERKCVQQLRHLQAQAALANLVTIQQRLCSALALEASVCKWVDVDNVQLDEAAASLPCNLQTLMSPR